MQLEVKSLTFISIYEWLNQFGFNSEIRLIIKIKMFLLVVGKLFTPIVASALWWNFESSLTKTDIHIHFHLPVDRAIQFGKVGPISDLLWFTCWQLPTTTTDFRKNSFLRSKETDILHPIPKKSRDFSLFYFLLQYLK